MRQLNLDQLSTLATVAATGSFSAAARKLNLTQPAVSQQIKELETRLGLTLVERIGRRVQLNSAGQEMLEHARDLLDRAEAAVASMDHYRDGKLGRVRLGGDTTLCAFVLPPILRGLLRAYPDLELAVEAGPSAALVHKVAANELDVAIVTRPPTMPPILSSTTVITNEFLAYWPDTLGPAPETVTPAALHGKPFVCFTPGNVTHAIVQAWLDAGGSHPAPILGFDTGVTMAAIVAAGLGASILPPEVGPLAQSLGSVAIRPIAPPIRREVVSVMRHDKRRTPALRVLDTALAALAATQGATG